MSVTRSAAAAADLPALDAAISQCRACPRLVAWREEVAADPPGGVPRRGVLGPAGAGFGPADARIAILGLAPAAHGGNRTGRVFTGDRSGDVLFAALYRAGLANQPTSVAADDGLELVDTRIFAAVRCAPPDNKPTPAERDTCAPVAAPRVRRCCARRCGWWSRSGAFAWAAFWPALRGGLRCAGARARGRRSATARGWTCPVRRSLLGCYHVSQQNTFTGRLTPAMLDEVLAAAQRPIACRSAVTRGRSPADDEG